MKTWMLSIVLLLSVSFQAFGEGRTALTDHGDPGTAYLPPATSDRAPVPNRDAKLYQMISACLADRPGTNKAAQDDLIKKMLQK